MQNISLKIFAVLKRIVLSFCFIYGFNIVASGLDLFIPINIITVSVVALLGFPGLLALIAIYFVLH